MAKENNTKKCLQDEEIINLYWARNETAIDETDKKYRNYLFSVAYNIVHDDLDCEECLNDTYLSTWNSIPPKRPGVFHSFLAKITRNAAIDKYRENSASKRIPSEFVVSLEEFGECVDLASSSDQEIEEIARIMNQYINNLSEREEFEFVCRYYYSDKISKISELLDISESQVYRDLANIRKNLKEAIESEGYEI